MMFQTVHQPVNHTLRLLLLVLVTATLLVAGAVPFGAHAQQAKPANTGMVGPVAPSELMNQRVTTLARLEDLREQISAREKELKALRKATRGVDAGSLDAEQKRLLKELPARLSALEASFEQIAVNGLDLSVLKNTQSEKYDWEAELVEIVRPVIGSMKSLTEKPRRIEALRQAIRRADLQEQTLTKAIVSLEALQQGKTGRVGDQIQSLRQRWQEQLDQTVSSRQVAHFRLQTLEKGDEQSILQTVQLQFNEFLAGRGITLAILATVMATIWLISRLGLSIILRVGQSGQSSQRRRSRERAMHYLYRAFTGLLLVGAALVVFYLRSDVLLLALSIIGIVMAAAGLRQAVPRYISEIRILLGFGSVREGERLVFNDVPMIVRSINAFARLENPLLQGSIRVPLKAMMDFSSRPVTDEYWFPCEVGDYLLLNDNRFAQVVSQSVETVQLRVLGSPVQMATADFLAMAPVNLSRDGFLVSVAFGIDYCHQAICLDEVPEKMEKAVQHSISSSNWAAHCDGVSVEFKEAAASSLDYLVLVRMQGDAAGGYFGIGRRVQQALVALSNQEQWSIPFGQLTVHAGDGFLTDATRSTTSATPVDSRQTGDHSHGTEPASSVA